MVFVLVLYDRDDTRVTGDYCTALKIALFLINFQPNIQKWKTKRIEKKADFKFFCGELIEIE